MQETIRENFVLLSKVAKEKKYAQEYLGLLARRGDIGSIRIGKRWYTTWQWFEEFLENSQKKKEVVSEMSVVAPMQAELVKETFPAIEKEEIKINIPFVFPEREKVLVAQPATQSQIEENVFDEPAKVSVSVKTRLAGTPFQKNAAGDIRGIKERREVGERRMANRQAAKVPTGNCVPNTKRQPLAKLQNETKFTNISVAERNRHAVPYREIKFKKSASVFSPDLLAVEKEFAPIFGRLTFAFSFAVIILLVAASGYFVWSGGLLKEGQVAGASDERNGGYAGIISGGDYFLASTGDKVKESLSISRVIVEAAKEKQETVNSEQ